jgi:hypothetical protein
MMTPEQKPGAEQPHVDHWPMWDEPLSKITAPPAPIDIDQARRQPGRWITLNFLVRCHLCHFF